ncbi:hypothetical protein K2173_008991 [Erythroxylum novogranatense]|uniref:Leucine-rich repeat-containing N-terminal plant-type domain-containing protein n=1 Tax=Erythroxylum novogranatense TaxID=1862640 RepID=A0AAV8TV17_9ROSI|nr:hypothetical protein K2173_008991 [Erythroxylum novogranatense]
MQSLRWVFQLLLLYSIIDASASAICSDADREALLAFKASIKKDATDSLYTWVGRDCCTGEWEGVQCNPDTGRVTQLVFQGDVRDGGYYMIGKLSPSLGSLCYLETLQITGMKHITGPIPESFSKLTHLKALVLEDNSLQGNVPSGLAHLSNLVMLSLAGNHLSGNIPSSLGNLTNLQILGLSRNSLTGPIPNSFENFRSLLNLDLSFNSLSGLIPDMFGSSPNLNFLQLSHNRLSGEIPNSVFKLAQLQNLYLDNNQLMGKLPDQISALKSLEYLSLGSNNLTGPIPLSLSTLPKLWHLDLSRNRFFHPVPVLQARAFPSLISVDLSYNNLTLGTVPSWIKDRAFSEVNLAGCGIRGTLPRFARPDSLDTLDLSDNFLAGGVSGFLGNMSNLKTLKLSNNQLRFDIQEIRLPDWIVVLHLQKNQITGLISRILNNSTSHLEELDVSQNQISGAIPEFVEGFSLNVLNIGSNKITGHIPSSISSLKQLKRFDISRNQITGLIPDSLGLLSELQWIDLSINGLTGKIPTSLLGIKDLKHANFRANRLCGEIPQGRPYNIFPAVAYAHNLCLCGKPMPPCRTKD